MKRIEGVHLNVLSIKCNSLNGRACSEEEMAVYKWVRGEERIREA